MYAVITRVPGGTWRLLLGPYPTVQEATDVATRVLKDTPRGEAILATAPWNPAMLEVSNVEYARTTGAIERVTGR